MEISMWMFWNIILTLVIAPAVWAFRGLIQEVKRMRTELLDPSIKKKEIPELD